MEEFTIEITALSFGGEAIGRLDTGEVCFVRGALPGELVHVKLTHKYKKFSRAKLLEILRPAPERIEPACPHFSECPGCTYLCMDYQTELKWKQKQFEEFIARNARYTVREILPPFQSPYRAGYRNKLTFHTGNGAFYYLGHDNTSHVNISDCLLGVANLRAGIRSMTPPEEPGQIVFRWTQRDGVRCSKDGTDVILTEKLKSFGTFRVPMKSFFQVNNNVADELVRRVSQYIAQTGVGELLELYCGVGVFSIVCAKTNPELHCTGIEIDRKAVKFAISNSRFHQVADRCRFFVNDAAKCFRGLIRRCSPENTCVLVDPPRSGLDDYLTKSILKSGVAYVLYISCSPDTLRRDLNILCRQDGYSVVSTGMLDMFPCTPHFESVTLLCKQQ